MVRLALIAVLAAAQEPSNAEIEADIQDRCVQPFEQDIDLAMGLPGDLRAGTEAVRKALPEYWRRPGYLVLIVRHRDGSGDTSVIPLSSVAVDAYEPGLVVFECARALNCIFQDPLGRPAVAVNGEGLWCDSPDRVARAFDTWIDRNVTRMDGAPPFPEQAQTD